MKELKKFAPFVALIMAILVMVMAFLPGATITAFGQTKTINGLQLAFGGFGGNADDSGFVFLNFLAYFGPLLAAIAIIVLMVLGKNKGLLKLLLSAALAVLFVLSVVFLLQLVDNAYSSGTVLGVTIKVTLAEAGYKIATGAIIGIVMACVGALASALDVLLIFVKKK